MSAMLLFSSSYPASGNVKGFPGHPGHSQDTPGELLKILPFKLAEEFLGVLDKDVDGVLEE